MFYKWCSCPSTFKFSTHPLNCLSIWSSIYSKFAPISSSFAMTNVEEVKVGLHCDNCIKKILKAVKKIQDLETHNVDTQLNKVTVTGNVTTEQVIRVLHKIGKNATAWDQLTSN